MHRGAGFACPVVGIDDLQSLPKPCAVFAAHDILARRTLAAAENLLAHTDRSIGEIAAQCGFTSASHLSLRLKEACGKTPLAYRKNGPAATDQ